MVDSVMSLVSKDNVFELIYQSQRYGLQCIAQMVIHTVFPGLDSYLANNPDCKILPSSQYGTMHKLVQLTNLLHVVTQPADTYT